MDKIIEQLPVLQSNRIDVAVFPLVNTVLFPGVTLPLRVFDERYQQMLYDVKARGWPLAISLATPSAGSQFTLNTICGAGEVQIAEVHPNGRCDALVLGQRRVKLCSIVQTEPYFIMEAETLDPRIGVAASGISRGFDEFLALVKTWAFLNPRVPEQASLLFDQFQSFGELSDFFAFHFLRRAEIKQKYLNCADPIARAEMLADHLERDLMKVSRKLFLSKNSRKIH